MFITPGTRFQGNTARRLGLPANMLRPSHDTLARNALMNGCTLAKATGIAAYLRNETSFMDGYAGSDGIKAGSSSNYAVSGGAVAPTVTANSQISTSGKTPIGTMIGGGGLAAAFDGTTSKTQVSGALLSPSGTGYTNTVGIDWGSGNSHIVNEFKVWGPNNTALLGGGGGSTIKLQGSTDNFASSIVDLYVSGTVITGAGQSIDVTSGITVTTAYRYHRINISGNNVNDASVAQVQFWESGAINNMTLVTLAQIPYAAPRYARIAAEIQASLTLPADLTAEVSADNETTYYNLPLTLIGTATKGVGTAAYLYDTGYQPIANTGILGILGRIKTLTNKNVPITRLALAWMP